MSQQPPKEQIKQFKARADQRNKQLYKDVGSLKKGLMLVLVGISVILVYMLFT